MASRSNTRNLVPRATITSAAALRGVSYRGIENYLWSTDWTDNGPASNRPSVRVYEKGGRQVLVPSQEDGDDHAQRVSEALESLARLEGRSQVLVYWDIMLMQNSTGASAEGMHNTVGFLVSTRGYKSLDSAVRAAIRRGWITGEGIRYFSQLDGVATLRLLRWLLDDGSDAEVAKSDSDMDVVANLLRRQAYEMLGVVEWVETRGREVERESAQRDDPPGA